MCCSSLKKTGSIIYLLWQDLQKTRSDLIKRMTNISCCWKWHFSPGEKSNWWEWTWWCMLLVSCFTRTYIVGIMKPEECQGLLCKADGHDWYVPVELIECSLCSSATQLILTSVIKAWSVLLVTPLMVVITAPGPPPCVRLMGPNVVTAPR